MEIRDKRNIEYRVEYWEENNKYWLVKKLEKLCLDIGKSKSLEKAGEL